MILIRLLPCLKIQIQDYCSDLSLGYCCETVSLTSSVLNCVSIYNESKSHGDVQLTISRFGWRFYFMSKMLVLWKSLQSFITTSLQYLILQSIWNLSLPVYLGNLRYELKYYFKCKTLRFCILNNKLDSYSSTHIFF